jgi:hypothetical protein
MSEVKGENIFRGCGRIVKITSPLGKYAAKMRPVCVECIYLSNALGFKSIGPNSSEILVLRVPLLRA